MDIPTLRSQTPGTTHRIHLNNAGASLMPSGVLHTIQQHLKLESEVGGYEAAALARDRIAHVYQTMGRLLGVESHHVALVENATAAVAQALSSIPWKPGDVLLTTRNDYASNQIMYLSLEARFGVEVVRAPDAPEGGVHVAALEELVHRRRPRLVAVTHIPTSSGLIQPVEAVGRVCRERDTLYLVDACQSVGQMPVHLEEIGCDFLTGTARKFLRGPRGAGFLAVSDRVLDGGLEPLFPDMRGADWIQDDLYQPVPDARRFENWEFAYGLVLGMGAAAELALELGLNAIQSRVRTLSQGLRDRLATVEGVRLLDEAGRVADGGSQLGAIVPVHVEAWEAADVVNRLRKAGVNTSSMDRTSAVMDLDGKGVDDLLRFSPHYFTTDEELDRGVEALDRLLRDNPSS
ncbi:MAG: aminotransferase class V-fold PLP-dependent enzyme [Gemmatimonadota bacterium]